MKALFVLALLVGSQSAFANPFAQFVGAYSAASAPYIDARSGSTCNWMNFQNVVGAEIKFNAKNEALFYVDAKLNGVISTTTNHLVPYQYSDNGVVNQGAMAGDANKATFAVRNVTATSKEMKTLEIRRNGAAYEMILSEYRTSRTSATPYFCFYFVKLKKN